MFASSQSQRAACFWSCPNEATLANWLSSQFQNSWTGTYEDEHVDEENAADESDARAERRNVAIGQGREVTCFHVVHREAEHLVMGRDARQDVKPLQAQTRQIQSQIDSGAKRREAPCKSHK